MEIIMVDTSAVYALLDKSDEMVLSRQPIVQLF